MDVVKTKRSYRVFYPRSGHDQISHWEWTSSKGLWVIYSDGLRCRSAWDSLREFLRAIKEHREYASEMIYR